MWEVLLFGFTQGFVVGPLTLFGIHEGLDKKRGFWYQMQVIIGSSVVDIVYLLLAAYGAAQFIDQFYIRLGMWLIASYMLIMMGVNTFYDRPRRLHVRHLHGAKLKFMETDFVRGFLLTIFNPLAIIFWIVVAGGIYADVRSFMPPWLFTLLISISSFVSASMIALATLAVKKMFHGFLVKKLSLISSLILIGYGIWFYFRATWEVSRFIFGL